MKAQLFSAVLLASLWPAAPAARAQFEHPDIKSGKRVVRSAVILPAQVSIMKAGVKSNEPLIEEGMQVEAALPKMIARVMEARGCKVMDSPFTAEALAKDPELKYTINDLQTRFDAVGEQLERKPKDVRKGRFTLGDEVTKVNTSGAEALVFVRANGFLSTGGKKAFAILIGGPGLVEMVQVSVTVVDGQTGAVLYHGRSITTGNFVKDPFSMEKRIDGSFKNFQKGAKGKKT